MDSEGRHWRLSTWFKDISDEKLTQLAAYHSELLFFNGRMNLISPRTEKDADLIHFADAILGGRMIFSRSKASNIYDVGSGNGIPGIVMSVLWPEKFFTLVDADARKAEYLKHCVNRLGLKNTRVMNARLEDLEVGSIQCAVSRGFANFSKSLLMARRAAALGCEFYHFKGQAWSSEVAAVPAQILANWNPEHVGDYHLPIGETILSILLATRTSL